MRIPISFPLLSFVLVGCTLPAAAQGPAAIQTLAQAHIVYTFENPQLQPARYSITIQEDGAGHFVSQPGTAPTDSTDDVFPAPIDREIRLDESLRTQLFSYARTHKFFQGTCDRGKGNLAFTGKKTLSYTGSDGQGSCSFVWAGDPVLQSISDDLVSVALTLEFGRRLSVEVRHDRLGLDAELASLEDAVKDRRAVDLPNIAPELQTIATDQDVMERARKRALGLLSKCDSAPNRN